MSHEAYDVVVIGGGISGLSYAYYSLKKGMRVAVVERGSLGGKIRTVNMGGSITEAGPEEIVDGPAIRGLISELGLGDRVIAPSASRFYLLYDGGRLVEVPEGVAAGVPRPSPGLLRAFLWGPLGPLDLFRAMLEPFKRPELGEDPSGHDLLSGLFGEGITSGLFETIIGNIYGGSLRRMSSEVYFPYILGPKKRGDSVLLRYMKGMASFGLLSFRDGLSELVKAIVNAINGLGVKAFEGTSVMQVKRDGEAFRVITASGALEAKRVAIATPVHEAVHFMPDYSEHLSWISRMIERTKVAVVNLAYEKGSLKDSRASGFLSSPASFGLSGCTFMENKWRRGGGSCIIRCFVPYSYFTPGGSALAERASGLLSGLGLVDGKPYAYDVSNFTYAIPIYRPGFRPASRWTISGLPPTLVPLGEFLGTTGIYSSISYALTRTQAGSEPKGSP